MTRKVSGDGGRLVVAPLFPGCHLLSEDVDVRDASVQALPAKNGELDLDHVEPGGMLGGVVPLQLPRETSGLRRREGGVERGGGVGIEVIDHEPDTLDIGKLFIDEPADDLGEVLLAVVA